MQGTCCSRCGALPGDGLDEDQDDGALLVCDDCLPAQRARGCAGGRR